MPMEFFDGKTLIKAMAEKHPSPYVDLSLTATIGKAMEAAKSKKKEKINSFFTIFNRFKWSGT